MGDRKDTTGFGRISSRFATTRWTHVLRAASSKEQSGRESLNDLLGRYWKPVYYYLRRKGFDEEEAKDLTQGFFHEVVLGRDLIGQANRSKWRFRSFLLTALRRYTADVHRREVAGRRAPERPILSLNGQQGVQVDVPGWASPEDAFQYAWASTLLDGVLSRVESELRASGKASHWEVFSARVLRPTLDGTEAEPMSFLCRRLGISSEARASNMVVTVKRRFRAALVQAVLEVVEREEDVEAEIRDLMEILGRGGAG